MTELLSVALITVLAVVSPGPDFAMVTRNSFAHGRKAGLLASLGIALGVQVHVFYTVFGIAIVIAHTPLAFAFMKYAGAAYLIYVGFKSYTNKTPMSLSLEQAADAWSPWAALRSGFLTNALNPKTMLFVVSTYTQVVRPESSLGLNLAYGFFMSFAHWAWFSLVAVFFSSDGLRRILLGQQKAVDRVIGGALMGLGLSLAFTAVKL
ncbi:lysine transporter LysE [Hylemonella gracilis str. Niagara R]|uniref:Lysine transporter LysE n=1 Tax=Hylemonella gracilis str. Niagara R TaxID=1458275 RepID=A0A016XFJ9_9BURK|nr:LysE family translocator [Hylemonella gracilis]EYC50576.1 lysine transporter LysE [Hylemonella gracilis str. Niagara R]